MLDICCVGGEFYVYDAEGCVKWFGLLSIKECVSKLYEMGEIKQCLMVSILAGNDTFNIVINNLFD